MAVYVFKINTITKTIQPGWKITESANSRNRMDFQVLSLDGSFRIANDDAISLTEDGTTIFAGLVDDPSEAGLGGVGASSAIVLQASAADFNIYPSRIAVGTDTSRASESLKDRLTWIVGLLSAQSVTLDVSQATGPTLPAASYASDRLIQDVLDETMALANGTGSTSWIWDISYTLVLSAIVAGSAATPFNITDGDGNVDGDITVDQARPSTYANYDVLLAGSGQRFIEFERHDGDGIVRRFALDAPVVSLVGALRIDGGAGGDPVGVFGVDDMPWTFDFSTNELVQRSDQTIIAVGHFIEMSYNGQLPIRVIADGGLSAASRVTKIYTTDYMPKIAAQALVSSFLTRDMQSPKTVKYNAAYTKVNLHPGQTQTITSTKRNLSGTHLLTEVIILNVIGLLVQRQVTAVSSSRLPSTIREEFQQTFGSTTAPSASAVASVIVVSGTTVLPSSPLGGSRDRSNPDASNSTYGPVVDWVPFVSKAVQSAQARCTIRSRTAGIIVTPRVEKWNGSIWVNDTTGAGATGTSETEQVIGLALLANTKYRLAYTTNTSGETGYCIGTMEALG